jgi:hypothetical protein
VAFGSNANAEDVYVTADFTDAYVDSGLNAVGGLVELDAANSNVADYGNHTHILNVEFTPSTTDPDHCDYLGAVRMVAYAAGNDVDIVGSDMGHVCAYSAYVDATSTKNHFQVLTGFGTTGCVYDPSTNIANTIECQPSQTLSTQNLNAVHIGALTPTNDWVFGSYTISGGLPPAGNIKVAWGPRQLRRNLRQWWCNARD